MVEIVEAQLPNVMMLDTGVLIRALEPRHTDPKAPVCKALLEAALRSSRRILVAAPSITEIERVPPDLAERTPLPRTRNVVVVALDDRAALEAARVMTRDDLKDVVVGERLVAKFDALIVGCALRWAAGVLVTLDGELARRYRLETSEKLRIVDPYSFVSPSPLLPFPAR